MNRPVRASARAAAAVSLTALALAGCSGVLDVENPNNVTADALNNPAAAASIVQGAENSTVRAIQSAYTPYLAATDETIFKGSRDDYQQLDQGQVGNASNEYINAAEFNVNEARWLADNAVTLLSGFKTTGKLSDDDLLWRAYINKGFVYSMVGDFYDDWTISDKTVAANAIGEANMFKMYDDAISALDKAVAGSSGDLKTTALALRARAKHAKAVWQKLNPVPAAPVNPLVADNGYVADATAALAGGIGNVLALVTDQNTGNPPLGFELNNRVEITPGPFFVTLNTNQKPASIIVKDIIETTKQEPFATEMIQRVNFPSSQNLPPIVMVSKYEMMLFAAEAALAAGNNSGFDTAINALRVLKALAPYTGAGPTRTQLLEFERRVALMYMGRRLNDMYRFGSVDPNWLATSTAIRQRGCAMPIGFSEREANPFLAGGKYQPTCR